MSKIKRLLRRESSEQDPSQLVTNATLSEHRQKIFAKGRRFVYPVYVAKHRIVFLSVFVVVILIMLLVGGTALAIYRYRSENDLVYRISRIIPFPAVKVNGSYGSYREYLLVLRSSEAFITQKNTDQEGGSDTISSEKMVELRKGSTQEVMRRVRLKQLAAEKSIEVSDEEINNQLEVLEAASGSKGRFEDIVGEYYGLSSGELREQLYIQLLKQKVTQFLDSTSAQRATEALAKLEAGTAFAKVAKAYSDIEEDPLGANEKGEATIVLEESGDYPAALLEAIKNLPEGGLSGMIYSPAGIHIIRRGVTEGTQTHLLHIFIAYGDINQLLDEQLAKSPRTSYLD